MAGKCLNCGFVNPETATFCVSCGMELPVSLSVRPQASIRNCVSCGRSIPWDAAVCPYCGKDYRMQAFQPPKEGISIGLRVLLYILSFLIPIAGLVIGIVFYTRHDPEYKHVGKICVVLAVAGILVYVGVSALLYVMILGFGGTNATPSIQILSRTNVVGGCKLTLSDPTTAVDWSDMQIELTDGFETIAWSPQTYDLISIYPPAEWSYGSGTHLGGIEVWLNVTDLAGNGQIDMGDYLIFTTSGGYFSSYITYTMNLIYEPTARLMVSYQFTS